MCVYVSGLQQQIFSQTPARFRSVMDRQGQRWSVWIIFLGLCVCVSGITRQDLFPFGEGAGDQKLPEGNDETQQISLEKPVTFFNEQFNKIYVSVFQLSSVIKRVYISDGYQSGSVNLDKRW